MQLEKDRYAVQKAGLGLAAISYDDPAVLRDFSARKRITFPLLSDSNSEVIRQFGVADRAYQKSDQLDLEQEKVYNGDAGLIPVYGLSYPAIFVITPSGNILWRLVSEGPEFRLSGTAILEKSLGIVAEANRKSVAAARVSLHTSASNNAVSLGSRVTIGATLEIPAGAYIHAHENGSANLTWDMAASGNCWTSGDAELPPPTVISFAGNMRPVYKSAVQLRRELAIRPVIKASDPALYKQFRATCLTTANQIAIKAMLRFQVCDDRGCSPRQSIPLQWNFDFVPPDLQRIPETLRRENH